LVNNETASKYHDSKEAYVTGQHTLQTYPNLKVVNYINFLSKYKTGH